MCFCKVRECPFKITPRLYHFFRDIKNPFCFLYYKVTKNASNNYFFNNQLVFTYAKLAVPYVVNIVS